MKNRTWHSLLAAVTLLCGCTSLFKLTEGPTQLVRSHSSSEETSFLCTRSAQHSLLGPQKNLNEDFFEFLKSPGVPKDFESKMIMWGLLNQNAHPILVTPSSGVVLLLISGNDLKFYNFAPSREAKDYPFFRMMQFLRNRNPKGPSLQALGAILEKDYRGGIKVSPLFQESLQQESSLINASPNLKKAFVRGDQSLSLNESISSFPFASMMKYFESTLKASADLKKIQPLPISFPYQEKIGDNAIKCSIPIKDYEQGLFHIETTPTQNLFFGVKDGQTLALAVTYFQATKRIPFLDTATLIGDNIAQLPAFCVFESNNQSSIIFSSHSRDPGQLLAQLINKTTQQPLTHGVWEALNEIFFLYLNMPPRVLYSQKEIPHPTSPIYAKKMDDYPNYYVEKIGEMIGVQHDPEGPVFFLKRPSYFAQDCHN